MDELKRLRLSRGGHRSHLSKLMNITNALLEKSAETTLTAKEIVSLTSYLEQLQRKKDAVAELDATILPLIKEELEVESDVYESAELQETLHEHIAQVQFLLTTVSTQSAVTIDRIPNCENRQLIDISGISESHSTVSSAQPPGDTPPVVSDTLPILSDTPSTAVTVPLVPPTFTQPVVTPHVTPSTHSVSSSFTVSRLPKLTIPTFNGDPLSWQSFWDCFDAAVHSNHTLTGVQKLSYLRAQLQGDASTAIAGFPLTNANYEHSITLLKTRFGQAYKLVNAHMQALLDMSRPTNSLSSLQQFHDSIESHIRSLSSLGKDIESYGALLVPIILSKLPNETKKNLARNHPTAEWRLNELQAAIQAEIRIFETGTSNTHPAYQLPTASFYAGAKNPQPLHQSTNTKKKCCIYCSGNHAPSLCDTIADPTKRLEIIKHQRLCFNCLGRHKISQCTSKYHCKICKRKHHTSICTEKPATNATPHQSNQPTSATRGTPAQDTSTSSLTTITTSKQNSKSYPTGNSICLLKTATATITTPSHQATANILFDEGSQRSFILQSLADELDLHPYKTDKVFLSTFGAHSPSIHTLNVAHVYLITKSGEQLPLSVLIVPTIAAPIHSIAASDIPQLPYLKDLPLAHPVTTDRQFQISLLIGADHYWSIIENHIIRGNGPTAMKSKIGYLLSGPMPFTSDPSTTILHTKVLETTEYDLQKFWRIESTGTSPITVNSNSNSPIQSYIDSHITRLPDGTYTAKFPWKPNHPPLPTNFALCERRTRSLINRLAQTPELLTTYNNILSEQAKRGFIERVQSPAPTANCHYIPHHAVKKNSPTTPIRIVYDCSSHSSQNTPSLNDCLEVGPPFMNDLCSIILRFRSHKIAISTDLEKAFLHVNLHTDDRDFTRFLWLSDINNPNGSLETFRFKVVLFGATSSPFMLHATLYCHLQNINSPIAADMLSNIYVDNIISGCHSPQQALHYYKEARHIMTQANFNLRAWASNCHELQSLAKADNVAESSTTVNVLGLQWNVKTDSLQFAANTVIPQNHTLITKREILQQSSKIFDPLGYLSPVTIQAKLLLQQLWLRNVEWDEPLPQPLQDRWITVATEIQYATNISINRQYLSIEDPITVDQLHIFADASTKAYGAVAYIRSGSRTAFIMAKTRVAPLKELTLPKLELMAAVVATRVSTFIITSLSLQETPLYLWSDSQIVLYWIQQKKKLTPFVSNRITEIHQLAPTAIWGYCPTEDNPADLLTRGITSKSLLSSSLWNNGPTWLCTEAEWPTWTLSSTTPLLAAAAVAESFIPPNSATCQVGLHRVINPTNYSKLRKLVAVTAYVKRFIANLKQPNDKQFGPLSPDELYKAKLCWIKSSQSEIYWKELTNLTSSTSQSSATRLPLVRQLRLFLDKDGFIRCGGRIHNAPLDQLTKFPYLLAPKHPFTSLIVHSAHEKQFHAGVDSTLTAIRQEYWIPSARQYIRTLLRHCTICKRHISRPYPAPDPAPLPVVRTCDVAPFTVTGIDFTGALYVQENPGEHKVYICLFTCATTRAVHLEVVTDLSTHTFLLAFRRFSSRKSLPQVVISDNGSTYLSAAEEIKSLLASKELKEALGKRGVSWKFIPKYSPWYGGFWERLVGLTKLSLKKVLGRAHISLLLLQTLVVEIEATLNDRPLTHVSCDITDTEPITPAHLLYGRRITSLPYRRVEEDEVVDPTFGETTNMEKRTKRLTSVLQHFRSRWKHEYLTALREFHKTTGNNKQKIEVGDIVLVHDDCQRIYWKLAIIESLIYGKDNLVRAANIRTANGKTNRAITRLYPLEIRASTTLTDQEKHHSDRDGHDEDDHDDDIVDPDHGADRSKRDAARRARVKTRQWCDKLNAPPEDVAE